jgi:hypothetical protein
LTQGIISLDPPTHRSIASYLYFYFPPSTLFSILSIFLSVLFSPASSLTSTHTLLYSFFSFTHSSSSLHNFDEPLRYPPSTFTTILLFCPLSAVPTPEASTSSLELRDTFHFPFYHSRSVPLGRLVSFSFPLLPGHRRNRSRSIELQFAP